MEKTPTVGNTPLVIITGLSGAGKSTAMRVFEDLGYYCVDNLPPGLIPDFYNLYQQSNGDGPGVVIASDVRSGALFDDFSETVNSLRDDGIEFEILYLDAANHVLTNRFSEVRRSHPLEAGISLNDAIEQERRLLEPIRGVADHLIDTSSFDTVRLREAVVHAMLGESASDIIRLKFVSFGFKYGVPRDVDFIFDVRFLPNPFYVPELRSMTGEEEEVYEYVMSSPLADEFFAKTVELLELTLESFVNVGKMSLTVGVGCTGGRHRSVALARRLRHHFKAAGRRSSIGHRDKAKPQH